jgi:hypothetical protein
MTNKEYLTQTLNGLNVADADIDIIMLKACIVGTDVCDTADKARVCDMAVYRRMSVVLKATMQNVTEGGYSLSWNMEAVKVFYNAMCNELGVDNVLFNRPRIKDRSNKW